MTGLPLHYIPKRKRLEKLSSHMRPVIEGSYLRLIQGHEVIRSFQLAEMLGSGCRKMCHSESNGTEYIMVVTESIRGKVATIVKVIGDQPVLFRDSMSVDISGRLYDVGISNDCKFLAISTRAKQIGKFDINGSLLQSWQTRGLETGLRFDQSGVLSSKNHSGKNKAATRHRWEEGKK